MMRWLNLLAFIALAGAVHGADDKARTLRFSKDDVGKAPAGWKIEKTGALAGSDWKVVEDSSAPSKSGVALAQVAESPNQVFNLCVADNTNYKDVELSVAFKAIAGKNDQGGGLVWRYQDHENYYVSRMNPLEDNYRVYKVVKGKRTQLGAKEGIKVPAGEWHRLKIDVKGDQMTGYLDGEKMWEIKDGTYQKAGKVGLWSKSDAQTHFDELKVAGE
ncbi:MAG TPA: family 16 glycoside hydrolase [Gemmataceae bacterium]|nr:family 16 glycoside hydrolase [Gemmataceae bacterium]